MAVTPLGSGRQQRSHSLPQVICNKINTHSGTVSTKIVRRKTHSETISKPALGADPGDLVVGRLHVDGVRRVAGQAEQDGLQAAVTRLYTT